MEHELWTRFRARFLESARHRVSRARELVRDGRKENAAGVASELHALAGEASVLGVDAVATIARAGERAARSWVAGGAEATADAAACTAALDEIDAAVRAL